jgi:hypothetical protein
VNDELYSLEQCADKAGVSTSTIKRDLAEGRLRPTVFILLSIALPAHAGLEQMVKDAIRGELERKVPTQAPYPIPDSEQRKVMVHYNLHWRMSARLGPISYRDDNIEDRRLGRFNFRPQGGGIRALRPENLSKVYIEIRKEF